MEISFCCYIYLFMGRMSDNSTIRYRGEIDYAQRSARREIFLREKNFDCRSAKRICTIFRKIFFGRWRCSFRFASWILFLKRKKSVFNSFLFFFFSLVRFYVIDFFESETALILKKELFFFSFRLHKQDVRNFLWINERRNRDERLESSFQM